MEKPVLSSDFTIEDIHKIREYHYELTKDMTAQEDIYITKNGKVVAKLSNPNQNRVNTAKSLFGILPETTNGQS